MQIRLGATARSIGHPARRFAAGTLGGGAALVALLVVLAPASMGATTITPAYHGKVTNSNAVATTGCSHVTAPHPFTFSLPTGKAAFAGTASASGCGPSFAGVGAINEASNTGSTQAAILLALPSGSHHVRLHVNSSWSTAGSVSGGGKCPTTTYSYVNPYNASQFYTYTAGDCYAQAFSEVIGDAYLYDVTNGSYYGPTGSNYSSYFFLDSYHYAQKYQLIYYGCSSGYSNGSGVQCFSYNSTTTGPRSFGSVGSALSSMNFQGTFNSHHTYALLVYVDAYLSAYASGWANAKASAALNLGTLGTGVTLTSIVIT